MSSTIVSREFPRLETERLILRNVTLDDCEAVRSHFAEDEVTKYLDIESVTSADQAEAIIMYMIRLFERDEGIRWGISLKDDKTLIGTCGFSNLVKVRGARGELKYDLGRPYWGRGIMTEALAAVIQYGFEEMDLNRIEGFVVVGADRSMRVLSNLGFKEEGTLREYGFWKGRFWDEVCFSLLKQEWKGG